MTMTKRNDKFKTHHEEYLKRKNEIIHEDLRHEHADLLLDIIYQRRKVWNRQRPVITRVNFAISSNTPSTAIRLRAILVSVSLV